MICHKVNAAILILTLIFISDPNLKGNSPRKISYLNDVQPVLAKAGCNLGVCHGNKNGKGGFKLSLRGQDPQKDYQSLTSDLFSRRIDFTSPQKSLILLKATGQVSHEGGLRFSSKSHLYQTLHRWIEEGAAQDSVEVPKLESLHLETQERVVMDPEKEFQIKAVASFSDGTVRDVSSLAVYEPSKEIVDITQGGKVIREDFGEVTVLVRFLNLQKPIRLAFIPSRNKVEISKKNTDSFIDQEIDSKLNKLRLQPSGLCDERTFVRRLYLDLVGVYPTQAEAQAFFDDKDPHKREKLIDALIDREAFADHWALKWSDLLRNEEKVLDRKGVQAFHSWIRESIHNDRPLNEFSKEILSATGSTYLNPPTNFYRANRSTVQRAESTAQVFLGIRLQCAKCHNHPFDRWTQDDYYSWASLFSRVNYKVLQNRRRDGNDKHEFRGEQIVYRGLKGEIKDPRTSKIALPRVLGGKAQVESQNRIQAVADWIASKDNPFFSKVQANRIWFQMMGKGLVDPIDDFRSTNPASHPVLLEKLTQRFKEGNFRIKPLVKLIAMSKAYQRGLSSGKTSEEELVNYARYSPRRLSAEALADSLFQVLRTSVPFNGYPKGTRASHISGVSAIRARYMRPSSGDKFLKIFGKPERLLTCECERSDETTLAQAFQMISGPMMDELLRNEDNILSLKLKAKLSPEQIITDLYLEALNRSPRRAELSASLGLLNESKNIREGLEDIAWSLLNSKEFLLRL